MPESGDSSNSDSSGFSVFKRRRQLARPRNARQDRNPGKTSYLAQTSLPTSDWRRASRTNASRSLKADGRGDICQLGGSTQIGGSTQPEAGKQRSLFDRLFGRSSSRRDPRQRPKPPTHLHSTVSRLDAGRSSIARERLQQRPHASSTLKDTDWSASEAQSTLTPRSRRPNPRGRTSTRLQAQPTLVQSNTLLQQTTLLQERDTTDLRCRARRSPRKREDVPTRPRSRSVAVTLYAARMLILSVGVGVLAGTVLSALNPANNPFFADTAQQSIKQASSSGKAPSVQTVSLPLSQEMTPLKATVQGIMQQYPGFAPGIFLIDLDNNNFFDWSGTGSFSAASTIKVPILIAFFQDVDAGKIHLDEKLTMTKELIASESGDMQYLPPGARFTALETATKMITISDNTATNMLIARLGGIAALNQRFKSWGLSATTINNALPDLKGTNTTSPKELASLMVRVSQGELVSLRSRDRLLDIMRRTVNNSQLPQGIGEGATIAHKTGDIGSLIGDVGLVDMPNGKRYAAAVLVKRSINDDRAYDLIARISRVVYQHLNGAAVPQGRSASPSAPIPTTPITPDLEPEADTDAQHQPSNAPNTPERSPLQSSPAQASTQ